MNVFEKNKLDRVADDLIQLLTERCNQQQHISVLNIELLLLLSLAEAAEAAEAVEAVADWAPPHLHIFLHINSIQCCWYHLPLQLQFRLKYRSHRSTSPPSQVSFQF